MIGAAFAAPLGVAAALLIAAAFCVTIVLCVIGLFLAALASGAITLAGAAIGGYLARGEKTSPTADTGEQISNGDYIGVRGNIDRRGEDRNANVLWWVTSASFCGRASNNIPRPFSYCEVDEDFDCDFCETETPPVIL